MNRDFVSSALARVHIARFEKRADFDAMVEEALQSALTQPFGKPLEVARAYSFSKVVEKRAVWTAVVKRLEEGHSQVSSVAPPLLKSVRSRPTPGTVCYRVELLTDVGPGTAGARLRDMESEGLAHVDVLRSGPQTPPCLLYYVAPEHSSPELEVLRHVVVDAAVG